MQRASGTGKVAFRATQDAQRKRMRVNCGSDRRVLETALMTPIDRLLRDFGALQQPRF
jgi:hypothetical protein